MREFFLNLPTYIFWILYAYIILSIIVVILLENRNPAKSLVWVLVLIFLPVVGVIFYAFVGQDYRRRKIISKKSLHRLNLHLETDFYHNREQEKNDLPIGVKRTINLLEKNAEAPIYGQNKIDIFTSGRETFEAIFADIESAKEHIHVEFYIIEPDEIGYRFRDLLIKKSKEGIRVRLIYDHLGSFGLKKSFLQPLKDAGVFAHAFLPATYIGFSKVNYRNHRKLIVVDGKIGYTGGINVADRYIKGNRLGLWRDTQVRLEGVAVHGLQNSFLIDWYFVSQKLITDAK
ncbi:MAG: PLDc N-terminal domain-containing protein, partial [Paludibacteraceae bacterium]|nr:PLDc N-terminal domain-containing protein [Paludibacteraceae bacterium]